MIRAEDMLRDLYAASARLQDSHKIAVDAGEIEIARTIRNAGEFVAMACSMLIKRLSRDERRLPS